MTKLNFSIPIDATREKIWSVLWEDASYRKWTSVFCEGSYAESDWKEGSAIRFLTPSGEGMYSKIARLIPNEYMSFQHIGYLENGQEMPPDVSTKDWAGARENYQLQQADGKVLLNVELDITEKEADYFNTIFPKALEKIKIMAENETPS